VKIRFIVTKIH